MEWDCSVAQDSPPTPESPIAPLRTTPSNAAAIEVRSSDIHGGNRDGQPLREMLVGVAVVVIRNSLRFNIEGQQHRSSAEQRHVRESVRESTKCSTPNRTDGFLLF